MELTKENLLHYYETQKLSPSEIGRIANVSGHTILRRLEKYGIPKRSKGEANKLKSSKKVHIPKEILYSLYVEQDLSSGDIADKYGTTGTTIRSYLKHYQIPIRKCGEYHNSPQRKSKIKATNIERHGVENPSQKHIPTEIRERLDDKRWLQNEHHNKEKSHYQIALELGVSPSLINKSFAYFGIEVKRFQTSSIENGIHEFLQSNYGNDIERNIRDVIPPNEIDLYLDKDQLAIEVDGIYWHTETIGQKSRNYHLSKTQRCLEKGITLLHIWDYEWINKQDIVKSRIRNQLRLSGKKIYARKCNIRGIGKKEKKDFLNENHIQGNGSSSTDLGLFYDNNLVSVMTFSKVRFSKNYEYELTRFCSLLDTLVVGAAGKLFSYFVEHYNPSSVVSYADRRWGEGKFYKKIGFSYSHQTAPNYFYVVNGTPQSRLKFQKHKLEKLLPMFNPDQTEWENMQMNGYDRIWDCGHNVYVWRTRKS